MPTLGSLLDLDRCPHCVTHRPTLKLLWQGDTNDYLGQNERQWGAYACTACGGVVIAQGKWGGGVVRFFPGQDLSVDAAIPDRAQKYLQQAIDCLAAPSGAVMLASSAVDAMLKVKGYTEGNLYSRIEKARDDHLITPEMAEWAHEVRLEANGQRHSDMDDPLPDLHQARKAVEFAQALGEFLYALPSRVEKGRNLP